ncbi:hypothetical protein ATANTOWER_032361 [Ataeniobius toweri]|uniref:Uncharacterized protein n=1 Tax=Ataeniobius toweri TaxID=208326 RepID=A0ABU7A3J4_9TELE|nr:hypothetical protein [Ataeniobius toweri]
MDSPALPCPCRIFAEVLISAQQPCFCSLTSEFLPNPWIRKPASAFLCRISARFSDVDLISDDLSVTTAVKRACDFPCLTETYCDIITATETFLWRLKEQAIGTKLFRQSLKSVSCLLLQRSPASHQLN